MPVISLPSKQIAMQNVLYIASNEIFLFISFYFQQAWTSAVRNSVFAWGFLRLDVLRKRKTDESLVIWNCEVNLTLQEQ